MIENKKMDLFDAPKEAMLVHACNCLGVWGSGIARIFRDKYSDAFSYYQATCWDKGKELLGRSIVTGDSGRLIGCLFTSYAFGDSVDSIDDILAATKTAILDMFEHARILGVTDIYSNRFNSGLFGVPWHKSEAILLEISENYPDVNWTVTEI